MNRLSTNFFILLSVILLLTVGVTLLLCNSYLWYGVFLFIIEIVVINRLYQCYQQPISKVAFLLNAIDNDDSAIRFNEKDYSQDTSRVNSMLNRIAIILYNTKQEVVQREKYYELILNFVNTGIVVLNAKGVVYQKNKAVMHLLGLSVFTHVKQLERVSPQLQQLLTNALPGDKLQIKVDNEQGSLYLAIRVSGITLKNEELRIVALSDINRELDEREIDTWNRLTRVLTHEIMNSLTPVTSITETLLTQNVDAGEDIKQGLETIHTTGKGLIEFVNSYRRFAKLPVPEPTSFDVSPFLDRMVQLARHQQVDDNVAILITHVDADLMLYADEQLIGQVVINVMNNAIQAIGKQGNGRITIKAYCDEQEGVNIEIANNGPRLSAELAEQIFVPFFTTKEEGSGIGLSISKQIMRLNNGTINLLPYKDESSPTIFVLRLN